MPNEASIRDFLAEKLYLIEDKTGLRLLKKEFSLENDLGAGGRIDILAKDQFDIFVIIEIKKSNKTAREALHELFKYTALFRTKQGIAADRIRCILISTDWHELLIPFSNYARTVDYPADGYQLILNQAGIPTKVNPIEIVSESEEIFPFPLHHIFLFSKAKRRDIALKHLQQALSSLGVNNYCILSLDYQGNNHNLVYRFADYLVLYTFKVRERELIKSKLDITDDDFDEEVILEQEVLCQVGYLGNKCDDVEGGNAEKLFGMLQNGWTVREILREGHLSSSSALLSDEDIIEEITSFEGGNSSIYSSVTTPKFQSSWNSSLEKVNCFLEQNEFWKLGVNWFLKKVETESKEASVSISIYSTCNILLSLYGCFWKKKNWLPALEIVAEYPKENKTVTLLGFLKWNGKTFPNPDKIFKDKSIEVVLGSFMFERAESYHDLMLMIQHGIYYGLLEITIQKDCQPIVRKLSLKEDDSITLLPTNGKEILSLREFFKQNYGYLISLRNAIESVYHFS